MILNRLLIIEKIIWNKLYLSLTAYTIIIFAQMHNKYEFTSLSLYSLLFIAKCIFLNSKKAKKQTEGFWEQQLNSGAGFALGHEGILFHHWRVTGHKELGSTIPPIAVILTEASIGMKWERIYSLDLGKCNKSQSGRPPSESLLVCESHHNLLCT